VVVRPRAGGSVLSVVVVAAVRIPQDRVGRHAADQGNVRGRSVCRWGAGVWVVLADEAMVGVGDVCRRRRPGHAELQIGIQRCIHVDSRSFGAA
jgi:hypothetical protein